LGQLIWTGGRSGLSFLTKQRATSAAEEALEVLGNLRGLAAKVGQMMSYVDGLIPEGQSEAFAAALSKLQAAAPSSPFAEVRALLEQELKSPLEAAFVEFDSTPFASASIGQVHRARLADGREVAVKVQHPGIREAVENDLKNAGVLAGLAATLGPRALSSDELFRELSARFREELDYRHEALQQLAFARLHASDPRVHIPAVIASHSTTRVLTTELVKAASFEQVRTSTPERRKQYAELLWHFVFKSILVGGVFNADPHPGNYLFHEDGRITFLDFGCSQRVSTSYLAALREMHRAGIARDEGAFGRAARVGLGTRAGSYESALFSYLWQCFAPLTETPFHLDRAYATAIVKDVQKVKREIFRRGAELTPLPHGIALLNRLNFGFYSLLARLDVAADYVGVDQAILDEVAAQPCTPSD
jgi:predicted unusual protein kinase regulating ubiquinone biosynthesis (AarF/ABC1/UbiB family)